MAFRVSPEPLPAILVSNPSVGRHLVGRPRLGGRCYISSSGGLAELGGDDDVDDNCDDGQEDGGDRCNDG